MNALIKFFKDEEGVTAVEYAIMVSAIAIAIIVVAFALGGSVNNVFSEAGSAMENP